MSRLMTVLTKLVKVSSAKHNSGQKLKMIYRDKHLLKRIVVPKRKTESNFGNENAFLKIDVYLVGYMWLCSLLDRLRLDQLIVWVFQGTIVPRSTSVKTTRGKCPLQGRKMDEN